MLIKRNGTVLSVTKGAFNALFKDKGWEPASGHNADKGNANFMSPQPKTKVHTDTEPARDMPFSNMYKEDTAYTVLHTYEDMTVRQLVEFAEENEIDLDGKTKKSDIIRIIKRTLGED